MRCDFLVNLVEAKVIYRQDLNFGLFIIFKVFFNYERFLLDWLINIEREFYCMVNGFKVGDEVAYMIIDFKIGLVLNILF